MRFKTQFTKRERDKYKIPIIDEKLILELDPKDERKLILKDKIKMSDFINESRDLTNFKKYITIDKNNSLVYNKEAKTANYSDITFLKKSGAENVETIRTAKKTLDKLVKNSKKKFNIDKKIDNENKVDHKKTDDSSKGEQNEK